VRALARTGRVLGWALVLACCTLLGGLTFVGVAGYHPLTVVSGSMTPAIRTGDLIVDETISPLRARPGDVVTFPDPLKQSRVLTHRVVRRKLQGTKVTFVTRGDANTGVERWHVDATGTIGIVRLRLPKVGYMLAWTRSPLGLLSLTIFPAFFLCGSLLLRIWRPSPEGAPA